MFKLVLKAERVYCYDWADLVCVCVCPSDPMYTTSETLRLSLTMAQMLDYMTDNHINDILMFQQFLLLHTFLGVSKSLPTQSVQGPKKYFVFLDPSYKTVQLIKLTLCSNFSGCWSVKTWSWANVKTGFHVTGRKPKMQNFWVTGFLHSKRRRVKGKEEGN